MNRLLTLLAMSSVLAAADKNARLITGERLPTLRGAYLTGRAAVLPDAAQGRVALLLLGFTYQSRFDVEAWAGRFRDQFGASQRVTFYEIPMIGGMARLGKWFIDSGMRRGTPKADYEHVITVYGATESWKQRVGNGNTAYLIVLDRDGNVAYRFAGGLDEPAWDALASVVRNLTNAP